MTPAEKRADPSRRPAPPWPIGRNIGIREGASVPGTAGAPASPSSRQLQLEAWCVGSVQTAEDYGLAENASRLKSTGASGRKHS